MGRYRSLADWRTSAQRGSAARTIAACRRPCGRTGDNAGSSSEPATAKAEGCSIPPFGPALRAVGPFACDAGRSATFRAAGSFRFYRLSNELWIALRNSTLQRGIPCSEPLLLWPSFPRHLPDAIISATMASARCCTLWAGHLSRLRSVVTRCLAPGLGQGPQFSSSSDRASDLNGLSCRVRPSTTRGRKQCTNLSSHLHFLARLPPAMVRSIQTAPGWVPWVAPLSALPRTMTSPIARSPEASLAPSRPIRACASKLVTRPQGRRKTNKAIRGEPRVAFVMLHCAMGGSKRLLGRA